jgi:hypothetical protein
MEGGVVIGIVVGVGAAIALVTVLLLGGAGIIPLTP